MFWRMFRGLKIYMVKKIMKRLKIGRRMYFYQLSELHKTLV